MNQTSNSFTQSNAFVFILAFLLGWCTYSLKLVSIIKLLGELDFKFYPLLMLAQGISLFVSMKVLTKASKQNEKLFYILSLITGFLIVFITSTVSFNNWALEQYGWLYSCFIFLLTTFVVLAIDMTTRLLVTSKISMLKNPKAAAVVTFTGEIGVISGALISLGIATSMESLPEFFNPFFMSIPFTLSFFCLLLITKERKVDKLEIENETIKTALQQHNKSLKKSIRSYLPFMIALLTIVMVCKHFQGFAVFIGLKQWQESSMQSIPTIFSTLAIIQNGLILLFIVPSLLGRSKSTNWTRGFNYFFGFQAMSMFFISIYPIAASLIGTGIIRKITQRSYLNKSLNMLIASIPEGVRFEVKGTAQKYAHSLSYLMLAVFSYLAIYEFIPFQAVWILAGVLSLLGLWVLFKLLKRLNTFHLGNIKEFNTCPFNVYEAITSCYALANKDATHYYPDVSHILDQDDTRSIFKKAIIHTIGEMKNQVAISYLMISFWRYQREDIQLEILLSLSKFKGIEIDNFFQQVLKQTMQEDTRRGELRVSLCTTITTRLPQESILLAQEIIEKYPDDERIIGNAIDVLGDIASRKYSKTIYKYLAKFLQPTYSRRIRINTIKHIYRISTYRKQIHQIIVELQQTDVLEDKTGSVYLCGILGIADYLPFINDLNQATMKMHSTVLLTMLRLEQEGAEVDFLKLLLNANQKDSQRFIKQLHRVEDDNLRYLIYNILLTSYPDRVSDVLYMMRDSFKNFDQDRQIIVEEAERMAVKISDDLLYQVD